MPNRLLRTPRLELRPVAGDDGGALHALWMHPDVRRYLWDDAILPRSETDAIVLRSEALFAEQCHGLWVATEADPAGAARQAPPVGTAAPPDRAPLAATATSASPDRAPLVGFCGFWHFHDPPQLELLYGLARPAWGRGLATEMAQAMLRFGYAELGLAEIQASTDTGNRASIAVMERLGMRFHRRVLSGGRQTVFYRLQREEFRSRDAGPATAATTT
jgi:ribosomal-protein-alanine N-acetyltransferase